MKYIFTVEIDTDDEDAAAEVRSEMVGGLEDLIERERPSFSVSAGDLEAIETDHHASLVEMARDEYCNVESVQVDDDARLSAAGDGTWVQGWLWIPATWYKESEEAIESEGGYCD